MKIASLILAGTLALTSVPAMAFGHGGGHFGGAPFRPHGGFGGGYHNGGRGLALGGAALGLGLLGAGAYGLYNGGYGYGYSCHYDPYLGYNVNSTGYAC